MKNAVDSLTVKLEGKEQERLAAEEARNLFQLERVCFLRNIHACTKVEGQVLLSKTQGKSNVTESLFS